MQRPTGRTILTAPSTGTQSQTAEPLYSHRSNICDLVIMIMGQLASFGLPWWRRAGRQTRSGVTPKGCPP